MLEFIPFPKLARLSRDVVITEKLDGTNAQIHFTDDGEMFVGSRTRWIKPGDDNYGFATWAYENIEDLRKLGPGSHFGEWWGRGIQRNYARPDKIFSLFNTHRWSDPDVRPKCCSVVPVLYSGPLDEYGVMKGVKAALQSLIDNGSRAAPGFMDPEGIVVYHTASNRMYKKTIKDDDKPKGK